MTNYAEVKRGITGADHVIHLASYGMSGVAQLDKHRVDAVNVGGTAKVLRCVYGQTGVYRLAASEQLGIVTTALQAHDGSRAC